jgi:hypothetical protein
LVLLARVMIMDKTTMERRNLMPKISYQMRIFTLTNEEIKTVFVI